MEKKGGGRHRKIMKKIIEDIKKQEAKGLKPHGGKYPTVKK